MAIILLKIWLGIRFDANRADGYYIREVEKRREYFSTFRPLVNLRTRLNDSIPVLQHMLQDGGFGKSLTTEQAF